MHTEMILKSVHVVLIDVDDFNKLKHYYWQPSFKTGVLHPRSVYRTTWCSINKKSTTIYLHKDILYNPVKGLVIDHINGNPLDNRKCNLRICTQSNNVKNRSIQKGNKSGYKGVFFQKELGKWRAQISVNSKRKHLWCFNNVIDAAIAYNNAALIYYREFAKLNKI